MKLTVRAPNGAEVKIEPNTVLRGTLHPTTERNLTSRAVEVFGRSATMRVVSPANCTAASCARPSTASTREIFSTCMGSFRPRESPTTSDAHS